MPKKAVSSTEETKTTKKVATKEKVNVPPTLDPEVEAAKIKNDAAIAKNQTQVAKKSTKGKVNVPPRMVDEYKESHQKSHQAVQKVKEEVAKKSEVSQTSQPANQPTSKPSYNPEFDLKELLETGAHFGHQARRWHPKMAPYIFDKRGGVHIFDLIKTAEQLTTACQFAYELGRTGKTLVFVGTKRQAKDIVKEEAEAAGAMYIVNRWLGGLLSNWEQVSKSLKEMIDIKKGLEEGRFNHYTKKERVVLAKKMERHERFFGGLIGLKQTPDALFLIDIGREKTALNEATKSGTPVIGLVDTNHDPSDVEYVIPANDDAVSSIQYIVHAVAEAYKAGTSAKK